MKKEDLIKCINESLEKGLVENLEYDFTSVQVSTGYVVDKNLTINNFKVIKGDYKIKIDFIELIK